MVPWQVVAFRRATTWDESTDSFKVETANT
jgi:hypothetical protein